MRILLVEDDRQDRFFRYQRIEGGGLCIDHASDGEEGLHLALTQPYDTRHCRHHAAQGRRFNADRENAGSQSQHPCHHPERKGAPWTTG